MELPQLAIITFVSFASAMVQASVGMGYAMLAACVLALVMEPVPAAALVSVAVVILGIYIPFKFRKHINWNLTITPIIGLLAGKALGVEILMRTDAQALTRLLGIVLVIFSAYFYFFGERVKIRPTPAKGLVLGILAGILGGMYNMAGPFMHIYFYSAAKDKYEYSASMNFAFLPSAALGLFMHIAYGNFTETIAIYSTISALAVIAGLYVGVRIFERLNAELLKKCLYVYMALMGLIIAFTG